MIEFKVVSSGWYCCISMFCRSSKTIASYRVVQITQQYLNEIQRQGIEISTIKNNFIKAFLTSLIMAICHNTCYAISNVSEDIMICDFKYTNPSFMEYRNGHMVFIEESGIENIDKVSMRFLVSKIIKDNEKIYAYGSLLIINEYTEEIAPSPIADSYFLRKDLTCIDLTNLISLHNGE